MYYNTYYKITGGIFIFDSKCMCDYQVIDLSQKDMMKSYFDLVDYKACEYSFMTLYMWQHIYNTHVMEKDDTMYVFGHDDKGYFSIVPVSKKKRWERDLIELEKIFQKCFNSAKIVMRAVPEEYAKFIEEEHPDRFNIYKERDAFDYVYDADKLRTLSGRKLHAKKNHFNSFLKEYEGRYQYKRLTEKSQFNDALDVMKRWAENKTIDDTIEVESEMVEKIFKNYEQHKDTKIGGIYIDGRLEAFTFADMLKEDMVCVHIEKANPEIRGLYPAINKIFLCEEYPDVKFVNREDDLGLENLRKAKMSYNPIELIEKYTLVEK